MHLWHKILKIWIICKRKHIFVAKYCRTFSANILKLKSRLRKLFKKKSIKIGPRTLGKKHPFWRQIQFLATDCSLKGGGGYPPERKVSVTGVLEPSPRYVQTSSQALKMLDTITDLLLSGGGGAWDWWWWWWHLRFCRAYMIARPSWQLSDFPNCTWLQCSLRSGLWNQFYEAGCHYFFLYLISWLFLWSPSEKSQFTFWKFNF